MIRTVVIAACAYAIHRRLEPVPVVKLFHASPQVTELKLYKTGVISGGPMYVHDFYVTRDGKEVPLKDALVVDSSSSSSQDPTDMKHLSSKTGPWPVLWPWRLAAWSNVTDDNGGDSNSHLQKPLALPQALLDRNIVLHIRTSSYTWKWTARQHDIAIDRDLHH